MLNPVGASFTLTQSPTLLCTMIVESLSFQVLYEPFDRAEFEFSRLREVHASTGEKRLLGENLAGKPYQVVYGCSDQQAVPLRPLTETAFDQVKKRFKIRRYTITGALSELVDVTALQTVAANHLELLAEFQGYQARVSGDISYVDLVAYQSWQFNLAGGGPNLTQTGITMAGTALDVTETNMLISAMSAETTLSIPTSDPSVREFYKTYSLTIENRVIEALRA